MAFPVQQYGDFGDEKVTSSAKIGNLPLGQLMVLPDGRKFRLAHASAVAITAGVLVMQIAATADHGAGTADNLAPGAAVAAAATTFTVTMGGTTGMTKDLYADGYMLVRDGNGEGILYVVDECSSAAAASTTTVKLKSTDPIITALASGTTTVGFRKNPYEGCELWDANAVDGIPLGITPRVVSASYYFWCQTSGPAPCLIEGTALVGEGLRAATAVDGALKVVVAGSASALTQDSIQLGYCMMVAAASTEYGMAFLTLE